MEKSNLQAWRFVVLHPCTNCYPLIIPYGFDVGQSEKGNVVKGLDLGVEGMRVGGQMNIDLSVADGHLCNMGMMIEELESQLRNSFDQAYFGKTKEVVCALLQPTELLKVRLPGS